MLEEVEWEVWARAEDGPPVADFASRFESKNKAMRWATVQNVSEAGCQNPSRYFVVRRTTVLEVVE